MRELSYTVFLIFFSLTIAAQEKIRLVEEFSRAENERASYWKPGLYDKAIEEMKRVYDLYSAADSADKKNSSGSFEDLNYNMARAYSLLNQQDSAVSYLQKYYDLAYSTYST